MMRKMKRQQKRGETAEAGAAQQTPLNQSYPTFLSSLLRFHISGKFQSSLYSVLMSKKLGKY